MHLGSTEKCQRVIVVPNIADYLNPANISVRSFYFSEYV